MVCIDDSAWFLKAFCCLSRFPLSCDFLGGVLRVISWGFLLGVTYEDLVPLWLVTFPQELP
jgi:hypothetical protein